MRSRPPVDVFPRSAGGEGLDAEAHRELRHPTHIRTTGSRRRMHLALQPPCAYHRAVAEQSFQVLDAATAETVEGVCDAIVPGSARIRPAVYIDALLARMDEGTRGAAIAAFETVSGDVADQRRDAGLLLGARARDRGVLQRLRRARRRGNGRVGGDRLQLAARNPARQGLVVPWDLMTERFDVVVVGSGAGGGVVAGELADRGRTVLLLECGPHRTAADFTRWEAKANHDFWWPVRFAPIDGGARGVVALLGARCVGGTTTVNTKVALRVADHDYAKWHAASGLEGAGGERLRRLRPRPTLRPGRGAPRCARAHRLEEERDTRSSEASVRSARTSSRCAPTPMRTA